jgi:hypothetical protein
MNFFYCFLSVAFLVCVYAQCGQRLDSMYQCTERVEQGSDFNLLKQRKMQQAQQCVSRNYTWQACWNDMNKMMTCYDRYVQAKNSDPTMQSQKQQALSDLDSCARNNPTSPFVVLLTEGQAKKGYGGVSKLSDMTMDGPVVTCLKTFTQGILETFMKPTDVAPVLQQIGLNADVTDTDIVSAACQPFADCLLASSLQLVNDQQVVTAARNVYNQKEKCKADFGTPFECLSSSKEQDQCTDKVLKAIMKQKVDNIKTCMQQSATPVF